MTLDSCIKRHEIWASDDRISPNIREEHKQIVKWLSSYKKLLEQEPCEDAISRQAVCNIVDDIRDCISVEGYWAILERLKKLQPVTPQPKTGHWIRMKSYEKWRCSECDTVFRFTFKEHDYCPKCGAKMIEPQESEDLGDYPDAIHNQFDNMTGSMNL